YNRPEATREKFKEEWFLSGDFGYLTDDGHLVVIDRMQDLKPLGSQGKKFSPQYIEARLRFSPFIKDVMVVSSNKVEEVGALINIDLDNTGRFAESNGIPYTTFTDLSQRQEIVGLIRKEIQGINETLPQESRVKRFLNFPKELDPDEAELTRTRKLRRDHVEGIYSNMVDALFGEKGKYSIEMKVSYRDGKKGIIKTDVYVNIID
ncbi:MAG: AMP-binding protein, partial [Thermodesulfobacteriota bacterium]|nr:AMP-binding protein [Thermodesulfobacteriota bacterium]